MKLPAMHAKQENIRIRLETLRCAQLAVQTTSPRKASQHANPAPRIVALGTTGTTPQHAITRTTSVSLALMEQLLIGRASPSAAVIAMRAIITRTTPMDAKLVELANSATLLGSRGAMIVRAE